MTGSARRWPPVPLSFLEEKRQAALEVYEREPVPTWRRSGFWTTSLRNLRLDELEPRHYDPVVSFDELPEVARGGPGDEELGGLIVQRGASTIFSTLDDSLAEQGVILNSLERAAEEHSELVEQWYMKRLSRTRASSPPRRRRCGAAAPSCTCRGT